LTAHRLKAQTSSDHGANKAHQDSIIKITKFAADLQARAVKGEPDAAMILHHMAKESSQALGKLPADSPPVQIIAGQELFWRMLMPGHPKSKDDPALSALAQLGVGRRRHIGATDLYDKNGNKPSLRLILANELEILYSTFFGESLERLLPITIRAPVRPPTLDERGG
jgi:hypothetical protein